MKRLTFKKMLDIYESMPTRKAKREFIKFLNGIEFKSGRQEQDHYIRMTELCSYIESEGK